MLAETGSAELTDWQAYHEIKCDVSRLMKTANLDSEAALRMVLVKPKRRVAWKKKSKP